MKIFTIPLVAFIAALFLNEVRADVKLPAIISDHMVLEKSASVPIWGKADPNEEVVLTINGRNVKTITAPDGKWRATLDLHDSESGPFDLEVKGKNTLKIIDVIIGEVWVASGQSNMDFPVKNTINAKNVIAGSQNPLLRFFLVKKNAASVPQEDTSGRWIVASPETIGDFSAVGHFFGEKLQRELRIPIGLIQTSWGGTPSEAWTSMEAIGCIPDLKVSSERIWAELKEYPAKKQTFVEGLRAWIKENSREDRLAVDVDAFAGENVSTEGWVPVTLPGSVATQGLPETGAVWLRKEIYIPANKGDKLAISLPIDGFDSTYWNGKLIRQITYENFPGTGHVRRGGPYDIPATEIRTGKNILAIRLYAPTNPAKFTADPKAGSISLSGQWLAKAEYALPALDSRQLASAPQPLVKVTEPYYAPGYLFNAMITPILPYAIKGVIWYQGEANVGRAYQYRTAFPLMISDWRKHWGQGDFPFYFCQVANYLAKKTEPGDSAWAELREAQSMALSLPNTAQAVLIDAGESADIHPRNKQIAGERLALIALAREHGKSISYSGPLYVSMNIENGKVALSFKHIDGGITAKPLPATYSVKSLTGETAPTIRNSPNSELEGFSIMGEDKKWIWADAKIDGNRIIVWSNKVPSPVAIRYGWADNPTCNLYNGAGLPASPFRTDELKPVTFDKKY